MIALRWAAFILAAVTLFALFCLHQQPNPDTNPACTLLVGFFLACFGTVAYTCRDRRTTDEA